MRKRSRSTVRSPNGNVDGDLEISLTSHEIMEAITWVAHVSGQVPSTGPCQLVGRGGLTNGSHLQEHPDADRGGSPDDHSQNPVSAEQEQQCP
jgi:hypothetical protein